MNYGMMKTMFKDICDELDIKFILHDFAEAIDWAEWFIAGSMPVELVSNLIVVANADVTTSNPRTITKPGQMLKLESARVALSRDENDNPLYLQATIVPPQEYLSKVQYSDDILVSVFNNNININPQPAAAVSGKKGAIQLVYKKEPTRYFSMSNNIAVGYMFATLDKSSTINRVYTTETAGVTLEDVGLDPSKMTNSMIIFSITNNVVFSRIDFAYTDGAISYVHISEEFPVPPGDLTNVYVCQNDYVLNSMATYKSDSLEPDIDRNWHGLILDLAIARFLMGRKPEHIARYADFAFAELQRLGVEAPFNYGGRT